MAFKVKSGGRRPPQGAGPERYARSPLTGLEAPLLQLDEARRLEQRVEEAHIESAARRARYERARCHAATGHARRGPLTWPSGRRANDGAARVSRGPALDQCRAARTNSAGGAIDGLVQFVVRYDGSAESRTILWNDCFLLLCERETARSREPTSVASFVYTAEAQARRDRRSTCHPTFTSLT